MGQSNIRRRPRIRNALTHRQKIAPTHFRKFGLKPKFRIYNDCKLAEFEPFCGWCAAFPYGIVIASKVAEFNLLGECGAELFQLLTLRAAIYRQS